MTALIGCVLFPSGISSDAEGKVKRPYDKVINHKLRHEGSPPEVGKAVC